MELYKREVIKSVTLPGLILAETFDAMIKTALAMDAVMMSQTLKWHDNNDEVPDGAWVAEMSLTIRKESER